ncbi:ATP-binding protein [Streptomyces sp. NPDC057684]|uniref:ATP-binding protein n=1 Tax=unclassified Streptomyces TaxID=2593676 RepID=UPI00369817D9
MEHQTRVHAWPSQRAVFKTYPEAVGRARDIARTFLDNLTPAMDSQATDTVTLVVSELITNAVRHACSTSCSLHLRAGADVITVEVADADPTPPQERNPDLAGGTGGFGWAMVRTLARATSVSRSIKGKTVRAELPR